MIWWHITLSIHLKEELLLKMTTKVHAPHNMTTSTTITYFSPITYLTFSWDLEMLSWCSFLKMTLYGFGSKIVSTSILSICKVWLFTRSLRYTVEENTPLYPFAVFMQLRLKPSSLQTKKWKAEGRKISSGRVYVEVDRSEKVCWTI